MQDNQQQQAQQGQQQQLASSSSQQQQIQNKDMQQQGGDAGNQEQKKEQGIFTRMLHKAEKMGSKAGHFIAKEVKKVGEFIEGDAEDAQQDQGAQQQQQDQGAQQQQQQGAQEQQANNAQGAEKRQSGLLNKVGEKFMSAEQKALQLIAGQPADDDADQQNAEDDAQEDQGAADDEMDFRKAGPVKSGQDPSLTERDADETKFLTPKPQNFQAEKLVLVDSKEDSQQFNAENSDEADQQNAEDNAEDAQQKKGLTAKLGDGVKSIERRLSSSLSGAAEYIKEKAGAIQQQQQQGGEQQQGNQQQDQQEQRPLSAQQLHQMGGQAQQQQQQGDQQQDQAQQQQGDQQGAEQQEGEKKGFVAKFTDGVKNLERRLSSTLSDAAGYLSDQIEEAEEKRLERKEQNKGKRESIVDRVENKLIKEAAYTVNLLKGDEEAEQQQGDAQAQGDNQQQDAQDAGAQDLQQQEQQQDAQVQQQGNEQQEEQGAQKQAAQKKSYSATLKEGLQKLERRVSESLSDAAGYLSDKINEADEKRQERQEEGNESTLEKLEDKLVEGAANLKHRLEGKNAGEAAEELKEEAKEEIQSLANMMKSWRTSSEIRLNELKNQRSEAMASLRAQLDSIQENNSSFKNKQAIEDSYNHFKHQLNSTAQKLSQDFNTLFQDWKNGASERKFNADVDQTEADFNSQMGAWKQEMNETHAEFKKASENMKSQLMQSADTAFAGYRNNLSKQESEMKKHIYDQSENDVMRLDVPAPGEMSKE